MYLLTLFRQQGLPKHELDIVYSAIPINRITYALPAWTGFVTADLIKRVNSLLKNYLNTVTAKNVTLTIIATSI